MQGTHWHLGKSKRWRRRWWRRYARLRRRRRRVRALLVAVVLVSLVLAVGYLVGNPEKARSLRQEVDKAFTSIRESFEVTPVPFDAPTIEQMVFTLTNEERRKAGLPLLKLDPGVSEIARKHSEDMVLRGFSHDLGGKGPAERAYAAGYPCGFGENIYKHHRLRSNEAMASALVDGWMESPGHRRNILRPDALKIGVGIVVTNGHVYATQNFDIC